MTSPVLLPAALALFGAERRFLALADDRDPVRGDTEAHQIIAHRARAALAERQVVLGGAARVSVSLDNYLRRRPPLHPVGVLLQHGPRVVADLRRVEREERGSELAAQLRQRFAGE